MGVILDVPWSVLTAARAGWDDTGDHLTAATNRLDDVGANGGFAPVVSGALSSWRAHWLSYLGDRVDTCEGASSALAAAMLSYEYADAEAAEHARSLMPYAYREADVHASQDAPPPDPADGPSAWPSGEQATPEPAP